MKLLVGLVKNGNVIKRRDYSSDHAPSVHDPRRVYQPPPLIPEAVMDAHGYAQNRLLVAHRNSPGKFRGLRAPVRRQPRQLARVDAEKGFGGCVDVFDKWVVRKPE